jgi:Protein of unknown function (DUF2892)
VSQLNIGSIDRALRIPAGLVLVVLAGPGVIGVRGDIGIVLMVTGTMAICSLYALLGVRTTAR